MGGACGSREPRTDAERLASGREIVKDMSDALARARTFSVTATENREQLTRGGEVRPVSVVRSMIVRRPDRLYVKATGDLDNEVWYDGVGATVVMHGEKVFAQARMPESLDRTIDAMHERYGIATPLLDFAYSDPADALLTATTTGGWVARESLDGRDVDHLAFKDTGVEWEIWIARAGERLPLKAVAVFLDDPHLRRVQTTFSDWNLNPQVASDRFEPHVGPDYEGIAILQRSRALRYQEAGAATAPVEGTSGK
jgi:hypothetical protein